MIVSAIRPRLVDTVEIGKEIFLFKIEGLEDKNIEKHLTDNFTIDLDLLENARRLYNRWESSSQTHHAEHH